ncbi:hypothetical protein OROGR_006293 [Orobanche gracilis]
MNIGTFIFTALLFLIIADESFVVAHKDDHSPAVEKGKRVYLSNLREKYFGEVFQSASANVGVSSYEEGLEHIARHVESLEILSLVTLLFVSKSGLPGDAPKGAQVQTRAIGPKCS